MKKVTHVFYVYCHNRTDNQDDTVLKIKATSSTQAKEKASNKIRSNFRVGAAYRVKDFRTIHPDWYDLLKDVRA